MKVEDAVTLIKELIGRTEKTESVAPVAMTDDEQVAAIKQAFDAGVSSVKEPESTAEPESTEEEVKPEYMTKADFDKAVEALTPKSSGKPPATSVKGTGGDMTADNITTEGYLSMTRQQRVDFLKTESGAAAIARLSDQDSQRKEAELRGKFGAESVGFFK